jgi:hypothetical protein
LSRQGRLIVVARADPRGEYRWLPPRRPGDVTVTLDELAGADLAAREPIPVDRLESWVQRSAAEHHISELLARMAEHPAVASIAQRGFPLYEFAEPRLRTELARLLRGWTVARAGPAASELICDPCVSPALRIGACAALGLDPRAIAYTLAPVLPGPPRRRALARQLMGLLTRAARPQRVRVVAVAAGKLALAIGSLGEHDLRAAGLGVMPFPDLDHGNGLLLALRRRLPMLSTYAPMRADAGAPVELPDRLGIEGEAALDRALTLLVSHVLCGAAPEQTQAIDTLDRLAGARSLRAIVLPSAAYGASRLLIRWARERGLRVGAMQHGIYALREFDGGDRRADVVFGWGAGTVEQIARWPQPRPAVRPIGVPGVLAPAPSSRRAPVAAGVRRVLVATSNAFDSPLVPASFCDTFIDALGPSVERLAGAGVEIALRPHPCEDPERYRRLLRTRGLGVRVVAGGPFATAAATADILIASASSVAFEAAAVGLPVLLWLGPAPLWLREEHLVAPWVSRLPGMFAVASELRSLVDELIDRPAEGLRVAGELSRRLARYAEPFDAARFAAGLCELGS